MKRDSIKPTTMLNHTIGTDVNAGYVIMTMGDLRE
jgi:hypothetical protein